MRLLTRLHLLLLSSVLLLQLLSLLRVALLHLLPLRFTEVSRGCLLVLFFLLLLQPLVFLILFGGQLVLLLLISLVRCRAAHGRSSVPVRLNFVCMHVGVGTCRVVVCWTNFICGHRPFGSFVRSAGFPGRYGAAPKVSGPGRGCDRRLALIPGGAQLGVGASLLHMLVLCGDRASVAFPVVVLLLCRRPLIDAAVAAIVADAVSRVVFDPGVIGVADVGIVYAIDRSVVIKMIVFPAAAFVAATTIAESVIDPAIISNVRAPIAFVEEEGILTPTPVSGGPKVADFGSFDPSAGHPVIVATIPSPITGRPDVAIPGAVGLLINGERRRTKRDGNTDLSKRSS